MKQFYTGLHIALLLTMSQLKSCYAKDKLSQVKMELFRKDDGYWRGQDMDSLKMSDCVYQKEQVGGKNFTLRIVQKDEDIDEEDWPFINEAVLERFGAESLHVKVGNYWYKLQRKTFVLLPRP